jgi:hypothetical protein
MIEEMVVVLDLLGTFLSLPLLLLQYTDLVSFKNRDVCEEIIKNFNNTAVCKPGGEEHIIQIRYSDTHEQKMLKQQTAAARQFRAAEFEYGCLEARRAGLLPPAGAAGASGNEFDSGHTIA